MPTREQLITLLSGADTAWNSVQGVGRHWRRHDLVTTAFHRRTRALENVAQSPIAVFSATRSEADDDPILESVLAVAADHRGTRRRADAVSRRGEEWLPDTLVINGDTFWARAGATVTTNNGDPRSTHGGAEIVALLLPSSVPAGFDLAPTGDIEVIADRTCAVASATPRDPDPYGLTPGAEVFNMIAGGDDFRLSIDLRTGILLKVIKFVDVEIAEICEFIEITLDEPLDDAVFAPLV